MSLFNGPPRGGSRGGKDQFNWSDVKADKDREYYLGHSVKALTGRWQKGKDVYWYTREQAGSGAAPMDAELRAVKEREEQLMAEALGVKPKSTTANKRQLEEHEMQQLLQRNATAEDGDGDDTRVKGVGYAPRAMGGLSSVVRMEGFDELGAPSGRAPDGAEPVGRVDGHAHKRARSPDQHKSRDKDKKHKKDKKEKKHKKDKKEKKDRRRRS